MFFFLLDVGAKIVPEGLDRGLEVRVGWFEFLEFVEELLDLNREKEGTREYFL